MILVLSEVVTTLQVFHKKGFICLSVPHNGNKVKSRPEAACALQAGKVPVRTRSVR